MPRRILVVRVDRVGDLVTATPLLRALKTHIADAHITTLVTPYAAPVLANSPFVDDVWTDDPDGADRGRDAFWRQVRRVREGRFDTALVVMARTRWVSMVRLGRVPHRIASTWRPANTLWGFRSVPHHRTRDGRHESDYALDLARAMGFQIPAGEFHPEVFVSDAETRAARAALGAAGITRPPVAVHPLSAGSAPNLPLDTYREIATRLAARGHPVVVTGSASEAPALAPVFEGVEGVANLAGRFNLRGLIALLRECACFVGGSTGPMHLAAAAGTPVAALFCRYPAVHPRRWGPLGVPSRVVTVPNGSCARCDGRTTAPCALPGLEAESVVAAALELLPPAN